MRFRGGLAIKSLMSGMNSCSMRDANHRRMMKILASSCNPRTCVTLGSGRDKCRLKDDEGAKDP